MLFSNTKLAVVNGVVVELMIELGWNAVLWLIVMSCVVGVWLLTMLTNWRFCCPGVPVNA